MPKKIKYTAKDISNIATIWKRRTLSMFNKKADAAKTAISAALQTGMRDTTVHN